jgi:hypothetical protein
MTGQTHSKLYQTKQIFTCMKNLKSVLLFCLPHKKVTKKVTATDKFTKIASLRSKKLNIAIKQHYHEGVIYYFIHLPRFRSINGNCQFFLTTSTSRFFNVIYRMRFSLVKSFLVYLTLFLIIFLKPLPF